MYCRNSWRMDLYIAATDGDAPILHVLSPSNPRKRRELVCGCLVSHFQFGRIEDLFLIVNGP